MFESSKRLFEIGFVVLEFLSIQKYGKTKSTVVVTVEYLSNFD